MPGGIGIDPSVRALKYWERRQEVMANNLANVSTPGFKGERVFARLMEDGGPAAVARDDLRGGSVSETGRPLDIAMEGDGFLVVKTDQGERYLRGGSFTLDPTGQIVTEDGYTVLGEGGPIILPPGEVRVERDGNILVDGATMGRLRVERPGASPVREGANRWVPDGEGETVERAEVKIRQGHLENSNVDPVSALVEMIEIQRAYSAIQRSVQTADGVMQTITTEIGRVGG
jgi:flagellar basal body rod protein FlgG